MKLTECGFLIPDFDEFIKLSSIYFKSNKFEAFRKQLFNYGFEITSYIRNNKRIIRANHEKFNNNQLLSEQIRSYRVKAGNQYSLLLFLNGTFTYLKIQKIVPNEIYYFIYNFNNKNNFFKSPHHDP